jgi:hypothetical protein
MLVEWSDLVRKLVDIETFETCGPFVSLSFNAVDWRESVMEGAVLFICWKQRDPRRCWRTRASISPFEDFNNRHCLSVLTAYDTQSREGPRGKTLFICIRATDMRKPFERAERTPNLITSHSQHPGDIVIPLTLPKHGRLEEKNVSDAHRGDSSHYWLLRLNFRTKTGPHPRSTALVKWSI